MKGVAPQVVTVQLDQVEGVQEHVGVVDAIALEGPQGYGLERRS
jgi:hypothetical protein